jgi:hypothetical protein
MLHKRKIQTEANPNLTPVQTKSVLDIIAVVWISLCMIIGNIMLLLFNNMSPEQLNDGLLGSLLIYMVQFSCSVIFIWNLIGISYIRTSELREGIKILKEYW